MRYNYIVADMLKEVEIQVYQSLQKGNVCTINHFLQKYSCINAVDIIEIFVNIFRGDKNANFDLLCHIVVANDEQARMQLERYTNIQCGVLIENNNHHSTYQFSRENIRQLKILAIFPKDHLVSDVESMLEMSIVPKTKEYVNKRVLVSKLSVENTALIKNKSKKEDKKQQKTTEMSKKQQPPVEQKKFVKKTQSKSSMEIEQKQAAPLKKVASKEQPAVAAPVLTNYAAQRAKVVEQQVVPKVIPSKKLCMDSDEEYYDAAKFNQQLKAKSELNQQTDHSAAKVEEHEKMEIETSKKDVSKFIIDDEDDEDESFAKMVMENKKKETQSQPQSQSTTQAKKQSSIAPPAKPKVEAPKPIQNPVKPQNKPPAAVKPNNNLMGWLMTKKV